MLILSRKINESVIIDGRILVKIVRMDGDVVKLGIEAPAEVPVHRQEVYEEIQRNNREALTNGKTAVPRLAGRGGKTSLEPAIVAPVNQENTRTVTH